MIHFGIPFSRPALTVYTSVEDSFGVTLTAEGEIVLPDSVTLREAVDRLWASDHPWSAEWLAFMALLEVRPVVDRPSTRATAGPGSSASSSPSCSSPRA